MMGVATAFSPIAIPAKAPAMGSTVNARAVPIPWLARPAAKPRAEGGSLPNTAPGAHPQLSLEMRPGSYTLFCSLPGHEAKGMKATLVVQ